METELSSFLFDFIITNRFRDKKNPNGPNYWMEHPDGHPDAGGFNIPAHHSTGHVHSTNPKGVTVIYPYAK